jgi:ABC-2 type transport system permease protein
MSFLFFQQWRAEWLKLLGRKRTYIGFVAFLLLELAVLAMVHLKGSNHFRTLILRQGQAFEEYYSALTVAMILLMGSVFLLGGIYVALVAGDIVAKENEDGHLRMLLARPVSRVRLLLVKYLTCLGYTVLLVQFIAWTALLMGVALLGWGGGFFGLIPELGLTVLCDWDEGMRRYLMMSLSTSFTLMTVTSVAFMLSCLPIKPAAATIGALSYMLIDFILRNMGFMEDYKHLLFTHHMQAAGWVLADEPRWAVVWRSFSVLGAMNLTFFLLGVGVFDARDLKS